MDDPEELTTSRPPPRAKFKA